MFWLRHVSDSGDLKTVGFFDSLDLARSVMTEVAAAPGFRDQLSGFQIQSVQVQGECGGRDEFLAIYRMLDDEREREASSREVDAGAVEEDSREGEEFILIGAFWDETVAESTAKAYAEEHVSAIVEVSPVGVNEAGWSEGFATIMDGDEQVASE